MYERFAVYDRKINFLHRVVVVEVAYICLVDTHNEGMVSCWSDKFVGNQIVVRFSQYAKSSK